MQISPSLLTLALAQALPAAPPDIDTMTGEFSRLQAQFFNNMLPWVLASQLIVILAYYIASKIVSRENGRFSNAIKLWIFGWATSIAIVLGVALVLYFTAVQAPSPSMTFASVCVSILLLFAVIFGLPIKVYKISFARSLGFIILTFILVAAGLAGAARFVPSPVDLSEVNELTQQYYRLPLIERKTFTDRITAWRKNSSDEALAADRSKSIDERHAAIQRIYGELETRRATLKNGDTVALKAYARDEARYQQLLTTLQADAAAAPAPKPPQ